MDFPMLTGFEMVNIIESENIFITTPDILLKHSLPLSI